MKAITCWSSGNLRDFECLSFLKNGFFLLLGAIKYCILFLWISQFLILDMLKLRKVLSFQLECGKIGKKHQYGFCFGSFDPTDKTSHWDHILRESQYSWLCLVWPSLLMSTMCSQLYIIIKYIVVVRKIITTPSIRCGTKTYIKNPVFIRELYHLSILSFAI